MRTSRQHIIADRSTGNGRSMLVAALIVAAAVASCSKKPAAPAQPSYATPEAAVDALGKAVASRNLSDVLAIFGADGKDLADVTNVETARQNRGVFLAAMKEQWRLEDQGKSKVLVIGHEEWPFPVPLVQGEGGWHFDTETGKDEVISRRIGRNEIAAIRTAQTYVAAQRRYAAVGHDGRPAGIYAATIRSDDGRHNGLYWRPEKGLRSPLGELLEEAEQRVSSGAKAGSPFHGYYFRILTEQGANAPGGARNYVVGGQMTAGFALVAWPSQYDTTGVMTFVVNQDGKVRQKDLGPDTASAAAQIARFDPDGSWATVE